VALASITSSITSFIGNHGVYAVFLLMAIDAVFPAASELVMVYAGAIAGGAFASQHVVLFGHQIDSHFWGYVVMALAGTLGYLVGAWAGWAIGAYGGRPLLESRGRWLHLGPERLDRAEGWFARHGDRAVFLGRITPLVRSFISIPAGVFRDRFSRYTLLTLVGSALWCFAFAGVGWAIGASWHRFHQAFDYVDVVVLVLVVVAALWLVARYVRGRRLKAG
jgi:membrane protein DedA with SNARE-associated domain